MTDVTNARFSPPTAEESKLEIANVWHLTFRTFRQAPWRFIAFAILPGVVSIALSLLTAPFKHQKDAAGIAATIGLIAALAQLAFQLIAQSGSIYAAGRVLSGRNFTIGQALGVGFRRFWPTLGLLILVLLIVLLGYLALVIPGIIAGLVLSVAFQACVIEARGPIESMRRSAFLTKGNRWRILGAYLLVLVVPMIVVFGLFAIVGGLIATMSTPHDQIGMIAFGALAILLMIPLFLVLGAVVNILLAVIFVELRRVKEGGFAREEVATVFD